MQKKKKNVYTLNLHFDGNIRCYVRTYETRSGQQRHIEAETETSGERAMGWAS
jgi:hypothetical protein